MRTEPEYRRVEKPADCPLPGPCRCHDEFGVRREPCPYQETVEEFWRRIHGDAVVWRTATRKEHTCGQCRRVIKIGERYLDTAEVIDQWRTAKCCLECAAKP